MQNFFRKDALSKAAVIFSAGVLVAIFTVIASASFASLIFNGPLNSFVPTGIRMALTAAVIVGIVVAVSSSCRVAIAIPQDRIVPILALLAAGVAARNPDASLEEKGMAVISAIVLVTLITGLFLFGLGRLRLGNLIRYIPYPVIGGFLAGSGWLLLLGGIRVTTAHAVTLAGLRGMFGAAELLHWTPALAFGTLLFWLFRWGKKPLLISWLLPAAIAVFYAVILCGHWSVPQARAQGWLPDFPNSDGGRIVTIVTVVKSFSWGLLLSNANILVTILVTSLVSILLTATALELSVDRDIDLNRELCAAGAASFISGLAGGIVGFHSLSMSRLSISLGARSRWVGVTAALLCALVFWEGAAFVAFIPRFVCGGLLVFLGLIFLWEWVIEAARKLTRLDYFVVLFILAVVGGVGYPEGVGTGVILAVVLFVHNYSQVDVVSHAMSGAELRSNVDRPVREIKYLRERGEQIFVLHLQGFIFFGTANHLLQEVRARAADSSLQRLRFVVMDLRRVTGIDSSAVFSLGKVHQLAQRLGFTLIMTHLAPEIQKQLVLGDLPCSDCTSLRVFPDVDHGLEWCEHELLAGWPERETGERGHLIQLLGDGWPAEVPCDRLLEYVEAQQFAQGSYLIHQTNQSQNIYIIETGRVTARIELANGLSLRLRTMGPGSVVGEVGMFLGGRRMASVIAESDCRAYCLSAPALERMRQAEPVLALAFHQFLIRLLAERLTTASMMLRGYQEQGARRERGADFRRNPQSLSPGTPGVKQTDEGYKRSAFPAEAPEAAIGRLSQA